MRYTLGIDVSTQSISAVILDIERTSVAQQLSLAYREDPRLNRFGIEFDSLLVPPREPGAAEQPPLMFLAGLDAILSDLAAAGAPLAEVGALSVSAQQHGHVYLRAEAADLITALSGGAAGGPSSAAGAGGGSRTASAEGPGLAVRLREAFSYGTAPIWQSANTGAEAEEIRHALGGVEATVRLSGSDSPLRFTGAVVRRIGKRYPEIYTETARVSLLSNFFTAVLTARPEAPIDWGNGSGMSLMDYSGREWSEELLAAVAAGLPGDASGLRAKLPPVENPAAIAGPIAGYFVERYGFDPGCLVAVGSGDNPQSKVMTSGDLFSLGSSFVYMVDTPEPTVDLQGYANSMYDGIGRPFVFACRTNGAMVWDQIRTIYGADIPRADAALAATPAGSRVEIWQPYAESYPVSPVIPNRTVESGAGSFEEVYPALVDAALASSWYYARGFDHGTGPLAVTGGPARSIPILKRIAAIWKRPVYTIGDAGAAVGSAVGAWWARQLHDNRDGDLEALRRALLPRGEEIAPDPEMVKRYHGSATRDDGTEGFIGEFIHRFGQAAP